MKQILLNFMACPDCQNNFLVKEKSIENEEIKNGILECENCHKEYKIINFIPRFVDTDKYAKNFSFEWLRHKTTQLDSKTKTNESEKAFLAKTGFDLSELNGKLILDAGCGIGRFTEIALKYGAEVIGIDISYAIDAAYANLENNQFAHLIQADIFSLPLKPEIFDYIYSIGVLHHTPSTKKSFLKLLPLLKRGGKISIWVYAWLGKYSAISDFWRFFTTKLPDKLLYKLCVIFSPKISWLHSKNKIFKYLIPIPTPGYNDYNSKEEIILDTFDWYSPKYQWKHTYPEVTNWFNEIGLKNIKIMEMPISVSGEKIN